MWHVAPESKIQLVSWKLYAKSLLGIYSLEDIHAIDAYIFCDSFCSVLFSGVWSIFVNLYAQVLGCYVSQWTFFSESFGFGKYEIQWFSYPNLKHVFGFQPLFSVRSLLEFRGLKYGLNLLWTLSFICFLKNFSVGCDPPQWLHLDLSNFAISIALTELYEFK